PPPFLTGAAGPQLAERQGPRRDRRRHALLARPRRGRLPHRRGLGPDQRRTTARQPALQPLRSAATAQLVPRRSARDPSPLAQGPRLLRGRPHGGRRDRRAEPPTSRALLRGRRRAPALVQLPLPRAAVERRTFPRGRRGVGAAPADALVA